jgi:hypothetical protein
MPSNHEEFSPDFFNNAAAIFAILIFAKSVSHRSRRDTTQAARLCLNRWTLQKALLVVCGVVSSLGLAVALLTTEMQWKELWADVIVWIALATAGSILIWDEILE